MRFPPLPARSIGLFLLTLLTATATPAPGGPQPAPAKPSPADLQAQARRCRHILKTSIIDFYLPACLDKANGGYFESLKGDRFGPTGEKFLTQQARQLWFFSTLARAGVEKDAALAAAKHGFDFLEGQFRDRTHGGYFAKVADAGQPTDRRKHVYLNAFALFGLAAYHRASGGEMFRAGLRAAPASALAFVILSLLRFGVMTATEVGIVAVLWSFVIGKFLYRGYTWSQLYHDMVECAADSALIFFLIAVASPYAWVLLAERIESRHLKDESAIATLCHGYVLH